MTIIVTVWNEGVHEATQDEIAALYPSGIHGAIAEGVGGILADAIEVRTLTLAETLDDPERAESLIDSTDVLLWWGHVAHDKVPDAIVERVHRRVLSGMGIVVLHSGHFSKIFIKLMGTTCSLAWRNAGEVERVWTVKPGHPIARGVEQGFTIDAQEMYGEHFDVPDPDELVFVSNFAGGEVFRSGLCYTRGYGRVFYFSPGDQEYPVYHHPQIRRVLANAIEWAAPSRDIVEPPQVTNSR
jgi:trehalose utilization protein